MTGLGGKAGQSREVGDAPGATGGGGVAAKGEWECRGSWAVGHKGGDGGFGRVGGWSGAGGLGCSGLWEWAWEGLC